MSNKKQSSIDWLLKAIDDKINMKLDKTYGYIINKAKQMHKDEIEDAWYNSLTKADYLSGNEYYKGTFGGQDNE